MNLFGFIEKEKMAENPNLSENEGNKRQERSGIRVFVKLEQVESRLVMQIMGKNYSEINLIATASVNVSLMAVS